MIIKETVGAESGYGFIGAVSLAEIKTVGDSVADNRLGRLKLGRGLWWASVIDF